MTIPNMSLDPGTDEQEGEEHTKNPFFYYIVYLQTKGRRKKKSEFQSIAICNPNHHQFNILQGLFNPIKTYWASGLV